MSRELADHELVMVTRRRRPDRGFVGPAPPGDVRATRAALLSLHPDAEILMEDGDDARRPCARPIARNGSGAPADGPDPDPDRPSRKRPCMPLTGVAGQLQARRDALATRRTEQEEA